MLNVPNVEEPTQILSVVDLELLSTQFLFVPNISVPNCPHPNLSLNFKAPNNFELELRH